jgi:hypothetical protein
MRIGDAERQGAVDALRRHLTAGRLDMDEFAERAERAYAARTAADLAPVMVDLPPDPAVRVAGLPPPMVGGPPAPARLPYGPGPGAGAPALPPPAPCRPVRNGGPGAWRGLTLLSLLLMGIWFGGQVNHVHESFWPVWVIGPMLFFRLTGRGRSGRARHHHSYDRRGTRW